MSYGSIPHTTACSNGYFNKLHLEENKIISVKIPEVF